CCYFLYFLMDATLFYFAVLLVLCFTLFPYSTLFRSAVDAPYVIIEIPLLAETGLAHAFDRVLVVDAADDQYAVERMRETCFRKRSEEHTSELQSRENLVCRLLLEKKTVFSGYLVLFC